MKCTCVVLNDSANALFDKSTESVISAFYHNGYVFEEVLILSLSDEEKLKKSLAKLKTEREMIAVFCKESTLAFAREVILSSSDFEEKGVFCGAAIYENAGLAICLAASDRAENGVDYVKNVCVPFLGKKFGTRIDRIIVRSMGASVARIDCLLAEAKRVSAGKAVYRHRRKYDEDVIEIVYDGNTPKMVIDDTLRLLVDGLGDTVYALEDITLEEQLVTLLKVRGKKISVAES